MRNIKGLRVDYETGEGDIDLDKAFTGQPAEFQITACSYLEGDDVVTEVAA